MTPVIEEVRDLDAAWAELEPLMLGIIEYHRPWDPRTLVADWKQRIRAYMAVDGGNITLIARDAGEAVAFLNGSMAPDGGIFEEGFAFINNIFVRDGSRGSGAGTALVRRFEEWARERGAHELRLHVNAGNEPGRASWGAGGFEVVEEVRRKPLRVGSK